jgi:hypothetical protein
MICSLTTEKVFLSLLNGGLTFLYGGAGRMRRAPAWLNSGGIVRTFDASDTKTKRSFTIVLILSLFQDPQFL